jgi:[ribosomal protein S5]-alanine N-acetyltransferase
MSITRLVTPEDAPALADLLRVNRAFLAPWEPVRAESFFTAEGQRAALRAALLEHQRGFRLPLVILGEDGQVAGRINLNEIVRGPFQSCHLGYWLGQAYNGRGLASAAVREVVRVAFAELGLHRIEAGTLLHNVRSQRVLERNGFTRFGVAPAYLNIAGTWQDHAMYQVVNPAPG